MSTLTPRQRDVLVHRIEMAICWAQATTYSRDEAKRLAHAIAKEIDMSGSDGKAAERAVTAIASRLEKTA